MKKIQLVFVFSCIFMLTDAQNYDASVKFYIDNFGSTLEGSLGGFDAEIDFNPDNPDESTIYGSVEVSTINTGINLRDKDLQKKKFFWSDKYPEITMESKDIEKIDEGNFRGSFDLTIKGTTKTIEFPFSHTKLGNTSQYTGEFKINRLDFDVGNKALFFGEEVRVEINIKVIE